MIPGQPPRYIGRAFVPSGVVTSAELAVTDGSLPVKGRFEATGDAYECEDLGEKAEQIRRLISCGDLIPADEYTAKFFGLSLREVKLKDGEMIPSESPKSKKEPS